MISLYRAALKDLPPAVWWICGATFVNRAGTMVLPFLGLYLRDALGFDTVAIGWILTSFGVGSLCGIYASGSLVDRFGGYGMQIASLLLGGIAFVSLLALESLTSWVVGTFVAAAVSDAMRPAAMASIAAVSAPAQRARSFGLFRMAMNAGMAVGPAVGGIVAEVDFRWVFVGEGATCIAAAFVLMAVPSLERAAEPVPSNQRTDGGVWHDRPFVAFVALVVLFGTAFFQLIFTLPLYLTDAFSWTERDVGLLLALNAVLIVVFELPLVTVLQKQRQLTIMGLGSAMTGLGLAVLLLGTHPMIPVAMMLVATVGEMLVFPSSNVVVAGRAKASHLGRYMGLYGTSMSVSFIIAPWLGLRTYEQFGAAGLWGGSAFACLIVLPLALGLRPLLTDRRSPDATHADR